MNGTLPHHPHLATPSDSSGPSSGWIVKDDSLFRMLAIGILGACLVHAGFAIRIAYIHAELISWTEAKLSSFVDARMDRTIEVDTVKPPEDKPPEPPPEPDKDDPPPPPVATTDTPPPQAPPAAAQAGAILAAQDDPNAPLDLTSSFVTGSGDRYAGGVTQQGGTSTTAVRNVQAVATGQPGGTGTQGIAPPSAVDRSRSVQRSGTGDWKCPFPPEADLDQIDEAAAIVAVTVGADGKVQSATIDQDPGHGFGREARSCALRESYAAALDRDGKPIVGTKKFRVLFTR